MARWRSTPLFRSAYRYIKCPSILFFLGPYRTSSLYSDRQIPILTLFCYLCLTTCHSFNRPFANINSLRQSLIFHPKMQYSTLRISTLVAVFSASTALAYLDCGGGRAPPKTTVPGCPGYVGPTSGVVSSIIISSTTSGIVTPTSTAIASPTSTAIVSPADSFTDLSSEEELILDQFVESTGVNDGLCVCSGYFCEFARPGCVSIGKDGVRSTITANPGYQRKTFDASEYSSYTATAGPVMYYSVDGDIISSGPIATGHQTISGSSSTNHPHTSTVTAGSGVTTTGDSSSTITRAPTTMSTVANATMSTVSTNATMSTNATVSTSGPPMTAPSSGASKVSGLSSLVILLGLGMGAMAWL